MKNKRILAVVLIAVVVFGAGFGTAYAYFSANTWASGKLIIPPINTDVKEIVKEKEKVLTISNAWDGAEVFIRARGFSGYEDALTYSAPEGGWFDGGDGWWYYGADSANLTILPPGESQAKPALTTPLTVHLEKTFPEDAVVGDNFNVVVVYESARVLYDESGQAYYAEWEAPDEEKGGN